jgi:Tol biopolymer transport system component
VRSTLAIYDLSQGRSTDILAMDLRMEAPNWHPDGWLLVNADGKLWRVDPANPALLPFDTGDSGHCNNDHGFSPDGRVLWFTSHRNGGPAEIWRMETDGGTPQRLDLPRPSWWHGVSPDGHLIAYAAVRNNRHDVDVFACPAAGGPEVRLTPGGAHSDGPDFSPCGTWVWYNSDLSGHAQIWRVRVDGTGAEQVFDEKTVNWFPHPSPCGQHVLYLAYPPGTLGHPADLPVELRLMDPDGRNRRTVARFNGGQGAINVPCWSPDGHAFAFVRHDL